MTDRASQKSHSDSSAIRNYPRLLKRYARLLELTSDLTSTLELSTLLQHIVEAAQELTETEVASLLLYDPKTEHLYFEAATSPIEEAITSTSVPVSNSIAGWILTNQKPLLVEDADNDTRFFNDVDILTSFKTKSILGAPLITKDKTLGVIEVVNKRQGNFQDEDLRMLQGLAAQAAIAIQNTRLFQQSDLVAEMVHELRTPLASLMAAVHLMKRPELAEDQRHQLSNTVFNEVYRLNDMTSDFLELARLESGRVRFARKTVKLSELIQECVEIMQPQADAEGVKLSAGLPDDDLAVRGDRNRLKQLLLNLLSNAIKYNVKEGDVDIRLSQQDQVARIAVVDTGVGIPSESLLHIFERFYRVPGKEGAVTGTGLGLAIAKRIAENHRGSIEVESIPGRGSTFTVLLPTHGHGDLR
jgi:signal transduction histidine kinase